MKNISSVLLTFFLLMSVAFAADQKISVAKIDYTEIEDLLQTVALAGPDHENLRSRYEAGKVKAEVAQKKMQEALMRGESINPMEAATQMMDQSADKQKVETLSEKYLIELLDRLFEGKYDLVLKESYKSALIYTKVPIDDVTNVVKQELLRALPTK